MSWTQAPSPICTASSGAIDLVIAPTEKDLGEFTVRRVLPSARRRMVGPFIFFDHMGPAEFPPGKGIAVRPHPHIGLATVTYLFEGTIMHRDSLGVVQPIGPGDVNLMTAGRGIVHSERAGDDLAVTSRLHGIQTWMALPDGQEEVEPAFVHVPAADLPEVPVAGATVRVIAGKAFGRTSPVPTAAPMLYLEVRMPQGCAVALPDEYTERAVYVVSGQIRVGEQRLDQGVMGVLCEGAMATAHAESDALLMIIGGEPHGERIERAKSDWREGRFQGVPGDDEFIPLPR